MKSDAESTPSKKAGAAAPLVEGIDFYLENGLFVFTALYHQKRGYCCQSGCRHCPYDFKKKDTSSTTESKN